MSRKEIKEVKPLDVIGEPVDLDRCPDCHDYPDCFSCMDGKCTALKESGGRSCVFYCPRERAIEFTKDSYQRLKEQGRIDLIMKYIKVFSLLGALDEEISDFDRTADELDLVKTESCREAESTAGT